MQGAEAQPAAARPGRGLVPRALGALALRRADLVPLAEAVREARRRFPRRGEPDVSLVISHAKRLQINERENRRLASPDALLVQYEARGAVPTNAPQTMRVAHRSGRQGAERHLPDCGNGGGGRRPPGERPVLHGPELLKHARLCSAITYASVQGLTLRGRVWLYDVRTHFTLKHLYMGCSRATNSELLSVL